MINKELSKYIGKTARHIALGTAARWVRLLCNIAFAFIFAYTSEQFLLKNQIEGVPFILGAGMLIVIAKFLLSKWIAFENSKVVDEVKLNLRDSIYRKALEYGASYINHTSTAKLVQMGVENVEQLENYYGGYITQFYYSFVAAVTLFFTVVFYDSRIAFIILTISFVIPLFLTILLKMVRKVQKKYWKSYSDVGTLFLDNLQGLTTLKVFDADEHAAAEMDKKAQEFRNATMKVLRTQLSSINVVDVLCYGGAAATVFLAVNDVVSGEFSLFFGIFIIVLAAEFFVPMRQLTAFFHVAMGGVAAGEQILEFLGNEVPQKHVVDGGIKVADITVSNLKFSYDGKKEVLKDVSIKVKSGSVAAFVGVSGCGKSTLASVLTGELSVPDGTVFYGGKDINSIDRKQLSKMVTRISHNGYLFKGTVRSNLLMAKPEATDKELVSALNKVDMWTFLQTLAGLDTEILSGGVNLSGGQVQRICMARGILSNSKVYIFDEAASNVDVESEEIILSTIDEMAKQHTVIYISHRLKSIVNADNIYVFNEGTIVEQGRHEELMQIEGVYKKLFEEQERLENFRKFGGRRRKKHEK